MTKNYLCIYFNIEDYFLTNPVFSLSLRNKYQISKIPMFSHTSISRMQLCSIHAFQGSRIKDSLTVQKRLILNNGVG
jgi:hypothetical protein